MNYQLSNNTHTTARMWLRYTIPFKLLDRFWNEGWVTSMNFSSLVTFICFSHMTEGITQGYKSLQNREWQLWNKTNKELFGTIINTVHYPMELVNDIQIYWQTHFYPLIDQLNYLKPSLVVYDSGTILLYPDLASNNTGDVNIKNTSIDFLYRKHFQDSLDNDKTSIFAQSYSNDANTNQTSFAFCFVMLPQ